MSERRAPKDPAAYKRERRQAVMRHHPDMGGSADDLIAALDAIDRKHGVLPNRTINREAAEQAITVALTALAGAAAIGVSIAAALLRRR